MSKSTRSGKKRTLLGPLMLGGTGLLCLGFAFITARVENVSFLDLTDQFALLLNFFLLVGVAFLGVAGYLALATRNPMVHVELPNDPLKPGQQISVRYGLSGPGVKSLSRLTVTLQCIESLRYTTEPDAMDHIGYFLNDSSYNRPRKQTHTETKLRHEEVLLDMPTVKPGDLVKGVVSIRIPATARPSGGRGDGEHGRTIYWVLCFHASRPMWPDVRERFTIDVQRAVVRPHRKRRKKAPQTKAPPQRPAVRPMGEYTWSAPKKTDPFEGLD